MDSTVSVSKGCFVFNARPKQKKRTTPKTDQLYFHGQRWYAAFTTLWNSIDKKLENVFSSIFSEMLKDLVQYVEHSQDDVPTPGSAIPVATLITGVNMPDHAILFDRLRGILHERVTPHVATLHARDCGSIRTCIEQLGMQLMNPASSTYHDDDLSDEDEDDDEIERMLKKHQCNFTALESWYRELSEEHISPNNLSGASLVKGSSVQTTPRKSNPTGSISPDKTAKSAGSEEKVIENSECETPTKARKRGSVASPTKRSSAAAESVDVPPAKCSKSSDGRPVIVVVIPDFEGFNTKVLQTLLTLASSKNCALPMTFVLGVATSVQALQRGLSFRVSSKLYIRVFHSQKPLTFLDHVLEKVFLTPNCPFHLGGRTFKLFCEVFLFYDFSVDGFIQHLKFCVMEHFFGKDINSLCCSLEELEERVAALTKVDLSEFRKLPSFVAHEEKCSATEKEVYDTHIAFKKTIQQMVVDLRKHSSNYYVMLQVLHILCSTLPTAPLGKHIRKLYESSITGVICDTKEYKECFKILGLQSRDELLEKLDKMAEVLAAGNSVDGKPFTESIAKFRQLSVRLRNAGMKVSESPPKSPGKSSPRLNPAAVVDNKGKKISRTQFLMNMKAGCSKQDHPRSEYEIARNDLISFVGELLPQFLTPLTSLPLHELVLFDNVSVVKKRIIGSPRAAIHMALNNPQYYLQCECCVLPSRSAVQSSLPDLCIAYKLHLECSKLINLYDWLQSFASVVNSDHDTDVQISPEIQARFASSVSELQLLGFVKASKKKADHVSRLTYNPR